MAVEGLVAVAGRVGVDLDVLFGNVDDPVDRHGRAGVDPLFLGTILFEGGFGNLDHEADVRGARMALGEVTTPPANHGNVWLGLAVACCDGGLTAPEPAGRQQATDLVFRQPEDQVVRRVS